MIAIYFFLVTQNKNLLSRYILYTSNLIENYQFSDKQVNLEQ